MRVKDALEIEGEGCVCAGHGAISTAVPTGEQERQCGGESRMGSSCPQPPEV